MAASTSGQNLLMTWLFTTGAATRPTVWALALHTGASGANGAGNEIVGNGYSRQSETFTVTNNVATAVTNLTFGPNVTTNWGTVTDFSLWTATSGGTCLWVGTFGASVAFSVGDSATVAASGLTFTLT